MALRLVTWGSATWPVVLELTLGQIYSLYEDRIRADAEERLARILDHQMALASTVPDEKGELRRAVNSHLRVLSGVAGYTEKPVSE